MQFVYRILELILIIAAVTLLWKSTQNIANEDKNTAQETVPDGSSENTTPNSSETQYRSPNALSSHPSQGSVFKTDQEEETELSRNSSLNSLPMTELTKIQQKAALERELGKRKTSTDSQQFGHDRTSHSDGEVALEIQERPASPSVSTVEVEHTSPSLTQKQKQQQQIQEIQEIQEIRNEIGIEIRDEISRNNENEKQSNFSSTSSSLNEQFESSDLEKNNNNSDN